MLKVAISMMTAIINIITIHAHLFDRKIINQVSIMIKDQQL